MTDLEMPSQRYYRAMHGRWRGRLTLALTDRAALATVRSPLERLAWRLSAWTERVFGRPWMETRMRFAPDVVVHETALRALGLRLASGTERLTLDPDGRRFRIEGAHRLPSSPWRVTRFEGHGEVAADARSAGYEFPLLGAEVVQTTRIDGEALVATQTTAFSRSEARLERRPERS